MGSGGLFLDFCGWAWRLYLAAVIFLSVLVSGYRFNLRARFGGADLILSLPSPPTLLPTTLHSLQHGVVQAQGYAL